MPAQSHEASCADDDERHRGVGGDDEVVNYSDLLLLFVIDRLAEDLLFRAPPDRHGSRLLDGDTDPTRARDLRASIPPWHEQQHERYGQKSRSVHVGPSFCRLRSTKWQRNSGVAQNCPLAHQRCQAGVGPTAPSTTSSELSRDVPTPLTPS